MATPETDTRLVLRITNHEVDEFVSNKDEANRAVNTTLNKPLPWAIWEAVFVHGASVLWNTFKITREISPYYKPNPDKIQLTSEQIEEYYPSGTKKNS